MATLKIIVGPTAVGKTDYSVEQAVACGSPIISCDSRQIYKEMKIGTAVPDDNQLKAVKHYFIRTVSVCEFYTAGRYEQEALPLINDLFRRGHEELIMSGGSGFYVNAVCEGLEDIPDTDLSLREELMERLENGGIESLRKELRLCDPVFCSSADLDNPRKVVRALEVFLLSGKPFSSFKQKKVQKRDFEIKKICLFRKREDLYERINKRTIAMMDEGLLQEAEKLYPYRNLPAMQTVGYKELFEYMDGKISLDKAISLIQQHTRNYAKRQLTWWKRDSSAEWIEI